MKRVVFKTARITAGAALVVLGLIGLFLPVLQGILLIVLGLGLLSVDIPVLKRWRIRLLRRLRDARARRRKRHGKDPGRQGTT